MANRTDCYATATRTTGATLDFDMAHLLHCNDSFLEPKPENTMKLTNLLPVAALALTACGGAPPPHKSLADAQSAVRAADEVGAEQHPQAALHLKMARDQIQSARAYMADEANSTAKRLLERAELDAEVALERAKAEQKQAEANQAQAKVRALETDDTPPNTTE